MKPLLSIAAMLLAAIAGVLWAMPTESAKADLLSYPAFHLECQLYKVCQDI